MGVIHIGDDAAFDREMLAAEGRLVVVDFFATWCGPCKVIAPAFEKLSEEFPDARFLKVDVDLCPDTAAAQAVSAMPTFKFFVRGAEFDMLRGANEQALEQKVRKYAETVKKETMSSGGQVLSNVDSDMWFDGDVREALEISRANSAMLLVFVRDEAKNDAKKMSARMSAMLNDSEVSNRCKDAGVVALKLTHGTVPAKQFGEVFPVVVLPTVFFLSSTGTPLEVIAGCPPDLNKAILKQKIEKAIDMQREQSGVEAKKMDQASTSADVQRAKVLIEQKKAMREASELEEEIEREKKRRSEGQNLQEFKHMQAEREAKELAAERRQAKLADKERLKRLRDQIAADREEKLSREQREKDFANSRQLGAEQLQADAEAAQAEKARLSEESKLEKQKRMEEEARRLAEISNSARIQVRFPDASTNNQTFDPDLTTLAEVFGWVSTLRPEFSPFQLSMVWPKRVFSDDEMDKTLRDLNLCPSATLVVLPKSRRLAPPPSNSRSPYAYASSLSDWLWWPWQVANNTINSLYMWWMGGVRTNRAVQQGQAQSAQGQAQGAQGQPGDGQSGGRVRRFADVDRPDNDDNAMWNGNSTQQL